MVFSDMLEGSEISTKTDNNAEINIKDRIPMVDSKSCTSGGDWVSKIKESRM